MKNFLITFDSDKPGSLVEIISPDGKINNEIKKALDKMGPGYYITVERRIVIVDGKEERIPSLLYKIK